MAVSALIILSFVACLLVFSSLSVTPAVLSSPISSVNQTFRSNEELLKWKRISGYLKRLNKPSVKTILSPDGDVIECVLSHLQPAFDHPELRGLKPLEPPERPKGLNYTNQFQESTEGTVPIRKIIEKDILRSSSIKRYGRKPRSYVKRDSQSNGHELYSYYGAKASLNFWTPQVTNAYEFSLSQIWVISGSVGNDLNTIEAGWQVGPELYGDNYPRFFTYWTTDAYQTTVCYNLLCSGFVQTNNKIAIGAEISPRSSYNGGQFDIGLMIWKDPKRGDWWLEFGSGLVVGYWPSFLFSHLRSHASMIQYGGEIVNTRSLGYHTSTQMGSGHFAGEGFTKSAYFRNLQVVDWDNSLLPLNNIHLLADHSNYYDINQGKSKGLFSCSYDEKQLQEIL